MVCPHIKGVTYITNHVSDDDFSCMCRVLWRVFWLWKQWQISTLYTTKFRIVYHHLMLFVVTAAWKKSIGLLRPFDGSINKSTHMHWQTHSRWPLPRPFTSYIRVPVATGQDRSHLNGAFLVHRWALSLPLLLLFFIVMSRVSNESRSACAGLLLQARWDSTEMTFGGWPTWCNHNAAFSYPFDNNNREVNTGWCTQMHACTDKASNSYRWYSANTVKWKLHMYLVEHWPWLPAEVGLNEASVSLVLLPHSSPRL